MKINDVEKITGLTQKAIRLYESKGLISVSRGDNGYRNYSEEDVSALKQIKLFRSIGVPIVDIKLYFSGVMSLEELMEKRKSEILRESGRSSENYRICERISEGMSLIEPRETLTETEEAVSETHGRLAVGVDIGTTTVSAVVYDIDGKTQLEAYTVPHSAYLRSDTFSEQSVAVIMDKSEALLRHILKSYGNIKSIGLSGQMHGIVYTDADGMPCSELINWQDKRADTVTESGESVCEVIERLTGEHIATGYGIATHYYNMKNGLVPPSAVSFCSIMDFFSMRICALKSATVHSSVAASFGFFDIKNGAFKLDKLALLGIDKDFLPRVTDQSVAVGECDGIPVAVAIGDNQASFIGAVGDDADSLLVNIGTGSQVSAVSDYRDTEGDAELRPFVDGKYLICGSALCGGYAYSMVEHFFRSYAEFIGMADGSQYENINRLALEAYQNGEAGLTVDVSFLGKRSDPNRRGAIQRIGRENFTPAALVIGVLRGMCDELYGLYGLFGEGKKRIVASGGAVRRNEVLRMLIADRFGMPVTVSEAEEEAAMGAAIFSRVLPAK